MSADTSLIYNRFQDPLDNPIVTLDINGTPGSTSYTYLITSVNEMGETDGTSINTIVAPDSLSVLNFVGLSWLAVNRARLYRIYRNGDFLAEVDTLSYNDTGADTPNNAVPPPDVNQTEYYEYRLWDRISIVPGRQAQSAEINEVQEIIWYHLKRLGDTLFKDGNIVSGASLNINTDTNVVSITRGLIYIDGAIRATPEISLDINGSGTEFIGINTNITFIDESNNIFLLDPAQYYPGYGSPGAYRRVVRVEWVVDTDPENIESIVWELNDSVATLAYPIPTYGELENTFARKIYDLHGHTLITNLVVRVFPDVVRRDKVNFEISSGKAYVDGYELTKPGRTVLNEFISKTESDNIQEEVPVYLGKLYKTDLLPLATVVQATHRHFTTQSGTVPNNVDTGEHSWYKLDLGVSVESVEGLWNNSGKGTLYTLASSTAGPGDYAVIGSFIYFNPATFSVGQSYYVEFQRNDTSVLGTRVKTFNSEDFEYSTGVNTYNLAPDHTSGSVPANCGDIINSVKNPVRITLAISPFTEYVQDVDFTVDTGRSGDSSIGEASITFISGTHPANTQHFTVDYYYWDHTVEGDYVYNKSYLDSDDPFQDYTYDDLDNPDQIDYRPEGNDPYASNTDILVTYTYYQSVLGYLVMDNKGKMSVIRGISSRIPVQPQRPNNLMVRYSLRFNPLDQTVVLIEETRYDVLTTYDLNVMLDRLENVEFNLALTTLEQEALSQVTISPKKGLFTEGFVNPSIADLDNTTSSMEFDIGQLILHRIFEPVSAFYDEENSSDVTFKGGLITLPYTEVAYQSQLVWTVDFAQNVNPYDAYGPISEIQIYPRTDYWVVQDLTDVQIQVKTTEVDLAQYSVYGTKGKSIAEIITEIKKAYNLDPTIQLKVNDTTDKYNIKYAYYYQDESSSKIYQITSSELIPILRQIEIVIHARGCPSLEDNISATFDGVAVNLATVTQNELNGKGLTYLTASGTTGTNSGTIKSSVHGEFTAKFTIPQNIPSGGRDVIITSPSGLINADTMFYGLGIVNQITEYQQATQIKYVIPLKLYSPLAESFIVTKDVFLSSIDLWVYRVPASDNGGLKVSIRGLDDGGQPNNVVYGSAFMSKAQIMTATGISDPNSPMSGNPSNTNKCTFTFNSLVYLKPGSYVFTIEDQAPGYYVYSSTLGKTILGKVGDLTYPQVGNTLKIQPFGGVMFISANNQSWELKQEKDILFRINRASFNTGVTGNIKNATGTPTIPKSHFAHITFLGTPENCGIYPFFIKTDNSQQLYLPIQGVDPIGADVKINPTELVPLGEMETSFDLEIDLVSSDEMVSPFVEQYFNYVYAYSYATSSIYRNIEVNTISFDNILIWIDELTPNSSTIDYEISFDSGSTWYTLPEISSDTIDNDYTEKTLGGSLATISSSAVSSSAKFILRITLANDASARYVTPNNRRLRAIWY